MFNLRLKPQNGRLHCFFYDNGYDDLPCLIKFQLKGCKSNYLKQTRTNIYITKCS